MKPKLVIGLGSRLVPKDAAGLRCYEILRDACRNPDGIEFIEGGTDLLRVADHMRGRELILLIDAAENCDRMITVVEHGTGSFEDVQQHAHHMSAVQTLDLIRWADANVGQAHCVWVLVCESAAA